MANELGYGWASIEKSEKHDDGTLTVYGKATDDSLDIDKQICDPTWLKRAMPDWFEQGGNIREQHSSIAAGVATDYELKDDGHYIKALVVDPNSVKKVETGVLKGFSIGIRSPRVIRDEKAAGGRIIDGQIVEVSLVDRPANPNAKLMLAKAAEGGTLELVDDIVKYSDDQPRDENGRFGSGGGSSSGSSEGDRMSERLSSTQREVNDLSHTIDTHSGLTDAEREQARGHLNTANSTIAVGRNWAAQGEHASAMNAHVSARSELRQAQEIVNNASGNGTSDPNTFAGSPKSAQIEGKTMNIPTPAEVFKNAETPDAEETVDAPAVEETVVEETTPEEELAEAAKSFVATLSKFDQATFDRARTALSDLIVVEASEMANLGYNEKDSIEHLLDAIKHLFRWYEGEVEAGEVAEPMITEEHSDDVIELAADAKMCDKCDSILMECKCSDKSADAENVAIEPETDESIVEETTTEEVPEVDELKSALEAEQAKSAELKAELESLLNKAAAGGPSKTAKATKSLTETNALLAKAAEFRAKAAATSDRTLAEGYLELAADAERKSK